MGGAGGRFVGCSPNAFTAVAMLARIAKGVGGLMQPCLFDALRIVERSSGGNT
jgi:hypothetical protein